jgi:glycine/D-amino acid oxidase-like deaminating enzyme
MPDVRPSIEHACYWLANTPPPTPLPLEGQKEADIVIVGAGFTGLWTAHHLKTLDPALEVAVLEEGTTAYGASGRNAGMLGEGIDHSHELAIVHFGRDEAQRLAVLGKENVAEIRRFLDERRIACDLESTGMLTVALLDSQVKDLEASLECARSLGIEGHRLLDRDSIRAEIHSDRYQGALFNPGASILDPVKLALGLRREAEARGVTVYERSKVTSMDEDGEGVRFTTQSGSIRARRGILAMSAYTHHLLPGVLFRFIPLYDYILVSEPLRPEEREAIGWRKRQGVTDTRNFFKYYRLTADDRILWGTSEAQYYRGNRVDASCDHSEARYRELRDSFSRHFPALSGLSFPYAWGGPICATTRFTPYFGEARGGRILYSLGFTGHGLATTHLAAKILAHLALERPSALLSLKLVTEKPFPYPPEPLRGWAVEEVTRALRRVDRGQPPNLLLRLLDALGIGLSS